MVLVLLASALFGTTGTTQTLGLPQLDPFTTGALRVAAGGLLLGLVALPRLRRAAPSLAARPSGARRAAACIGLGALGVVAYQPTFFTGVRSAGVAVGTLVALGSAPVFTGLLAWALLRRRPGTRWALCTAMAVGGIVLLSGLLEGGSGRPVAIGGVLAALGAGLAYAVYTLALKGLLDLGWSTPAAAGAVFGVAGVVGVVELVAVGGAPVGDPRSLLAVAWLGGATITLAYLLFARGLERLPAATVSTITLAEPVVAAALGVALLDERLTAGAVAGAVLLLAALVVLGLPRPLRRSAVEARP